ncbi:MAG TPA: hypothetical protein VMC79_10970 [Rectinemataceae bacterium]|nr:hypothetical protein [Rectinemataceae bacterium]
MRYHVPSYLIPGTWLENLRRLETAEWISGVELLVFSYDDDAKSILNRERHGLAACTPRFRLTLHLPDPLESRHEELLELSLPFTSSYVLHPPGSILEMERWLRLVEDWRAAYGPKFHLENTAGATFVAVEAALPDIELCADCGRLLLDGHDPLGWLDGRASRLRQLHLHSAAAGRDHLPLRAEEPWLRRLFPYLVAFAGIVELELFSLEAVERSRDALGALSAMAAGELR